MAPQSRPKTPAIILTEHDYERLYQLSLANEAAMPEVASFLQGELARARVVKAKRMPAGTVTMNTVLHFRDDGSGRERRITLVYPSDADIDRNRVSVMTPIGAALIGLSEGQSIGWRSGGAERCVSVTRVVFQPEAEGVDPDLPPDF